MIKELNPQQILEQLYAEYEKKIIDNQILLIDNWLELWTERASKIDYSMPHAKIVKGAIEAKSDWILEDTILYVLSKKDYKIGKSNKHGSYCANLRIKPSIRTNLQELMESGLSCYFYEDFLRLSCG